MELREHPQGNYHFLTGIAPYSSAVIAAPGYTLARFVLDRPVPYVQGFARIRNILTQLGRPTQALCAVELRIPTPLPFEGFIDFNTAYCGILREWGIYVGETNPVARTNVAPGHHPPDAPALHAFTVTLHHSSLAPHGMAQDSLASATPAFIVAGAGDLRDQADLTPAAIVRPGETSPDALLEKARTVLQVMEDRLTGIERTWADVTATNVYTVHAIDAITQAEILPRLGPAAIHSVGWYHSRPPIAGLEFEMDLRRPGLEVHIA